MYELLGIDPEGKLPHPQGLAVRVTPGPADGVKSGGRLRRNHVTGQGYDEHVPIRYDSGHGCTACGNVRVRAADSQSVPTPSARRLSLPGRRPQGATVEVTVGGQFLRGVTSVQVWGEGLQATVGKYSRPLTAEEFFRNAGEVCRI